MLNAYLEFFAFPRFALSVLRFSNNYHYIFRNYATLTYLFLKMLFFSEFIFCFSFFLFFRLALLVMV